MDMFLRGPNGLAGGDHTRCSLLWWFRSIVSPARSSAACTFPHRILDSLSNTVGMETPWKIPVDVVSKFLLEVITVSDKLENTVQPGVGLCINRVAGEIVPSLCMSQLSAVTLEIPF